MFEKQILIDELISTRAQKVIEIIEAHEKENSNVLDVKSLNLELLNKGVLKSKTEFLLVDEWLDILYELTPDIYDKYCYFDAAA